MNVNRKASRASAATARGTVTRDRIIQAAAELVEARGVTETTLAEIMDASRTSKSQLYHYFSDKEDLMYAVVKAQADKVLGFHESSLATVKSVKDLQAWRDQVVAISRATGGIGGCPIGSLASELADRSEDARRLLANSFRRWESHVAIGLKAMQDNGVLDPHVRVRDLAMAIVSALQGGLLLGQTMRSSRPLEIALDMALDYVSAHCPQAQSQ